MEFWYSMFYNRPSRSFNNMLLDFSKQCTDAMLEGLSNTTKLTHYPLYETKNFSILKKGVGIESEKVYKQIRDQKSLEKVKEGAQGLL